MRRERKVSLPGRLGDHAPKHHRDLLRNGLPGRDTLRPYVWGWESKLGDDYGEAGDVGG
jgi:hypothetical protein